MSTETGSGGDDPDTPYFTRVDPTRFGGSERYWRTAEECLGITLSPEQREILETVADNRYTYLEGANGFGKTYGLLALALGFFLRHYPSTIMTTSGTYGKLKRTFCDPLEEIHQDAGLSAISDWKWSPNPHIDVPGKPTWQFEVASPEDAGELEGVHNEYTLTIVEEADKDAVDDEVIESMESIVTDDKDRMIVVANPPKDELNIVNELRNDPKYHNLNFSTFDSHNVKVELGERDGTMIPGLATIQKLRDDWESYNAEPWPGVEEARYAHDRTHEKFRNDLDQRWYRRRGGVLPPDTAGAHRPIYVSNVQDAWERTPDPEKTSQNPTAAAIDVASSSDSTVLAAVHNNELRVYYSQTGTHHAEQRRRLWNILDEWENDFPIAVDAIGVGQALADETMQRYENAHDFKANRDACHADDYRDYWAEALALTGRWLRDGGAIADDGETSRDNARLKEEMMVAARCIEFDTRYLKSRDTDVLEAEGRDELKERLGHSPDHLDAALMAVWAHQIEDPSQYRQDDVTRVFRI